ncbi:MAG: class I SAM-dependent methyltransferase [Oscillospiraceae bacterium]|nr:class I SAM-dependent methyltransferase [Oscillospiraceae bacterium]
MFWDKVAGIYDLYQILNKKANNGAASICASYVNKNDFVLECACGTGIITKALAAKCKRIVATDFSKKMLCKARKNLHDCKIIKFRYADITDLRFKNGVFDVVVAANVIHLLDEPEKAISELRRVVKRGGIILIPTYISQEENSSAKITKIFNKMGANFRNEFNIDTYRKFFEEMGVEAEYKLAKGLISCCVAVIKA